MSTPVEVIAGVEVSRTPDYEGDWIERFGVRRAEVFVAALDAVGFEIVPKGTADRHRNLLNDLNSVIEEYDGDNITSAAYAITELAECVADAVAGVTP